MFVPSPWTVRMLPLEPSFCTMHVSLSLFAVALVEETIFCMHGGLSPDLKSLDQVCEHKVTVIIPLCTLSSATELQQPDNHQPSGQPLTEL